VARTYSLVSHPTLNDYIEFHIRVYPDGVFSQWVAQSMSVGDSLEIQGSMGECFYSGQGRQQTLFLSQYGALATFFGARCFLKLE